MDNLEFIIRYEDADLTMNEVVAGFAPLIADGTVWKLQGLYGRQAYDFVDQGIISLDGKIDWEQFEHVYSEG